jgi:hypothetical protein
MSVIKPLTPEWLHVGWKRNADDPDMVMRGWEKCGLRAPFDDSKNEVLTKSQLAMLDPDHPLLVKYANGPSTDYMREA